MFNISFLLLKRSCAKKLKVGEAVYPEVFEEATVFFSDIVGFNDIASLSSPNEIVGLLNDICYIFDETTHWYDAYKVKIYTSL